MRVKTLIGVLVAAAMLAMAAGPPEAAPKPHPPHHQSVGPRSGQYTHMPTPFSDRF
jgi:hypothetical protein